MPQINAAPKVLFDGIRDVSTGVNALVPEPAPQHLPLLRLFTETGPEETTLVDGQSFTAIYGENSLNPRKDYFNMSSLFARELMGQGNALMVKRVTPSDISAASRLIVAIDIATDQVQATNPDGTPEVDESDAPVMIAGVRARLKLIEDNTTAVGSQSAVAGEFQNDSLTQSDLYPLFELPASFVGAAGNRLGLKIWAPSENDPSSVEQNVASENETRIYRFQFLRKPTDGSSPQIIKTVTGSDFVEACFKKGVYSENTDREYDVRKVLIPSYEDDTTGVVPTFSPFESIYVYDDNIDTVQAMIYAAENAANSAVSDIMQSASEVDFLTATHSDGTAYESYLLEGPSEGAFYFGKSNVVYASGGDDGTLTQAEYEMAVDAENDNFGVNEPYENKAMYPFTVLYDTGLSMASKAKQMKPLGVRDDLICRFTTMVDDGGAHADLATELSRAESLMASLKAYPESTLYGTGVCRADVVLQAGKLASGNYSGNVPLLLDYAMKWADFAGAGSGIMREGRDIDAQPNNVVSAVSNLNVKYFNNSTQNRLWEAGAIYSLTADRRTQYYPSIRSVYADDTSVLLSPITVSIATDIIRLATKTHASVSGNARLTKQQLIEQVNSSILGLTDGRYNGRVVITPNTFFTNEDSARGFSWTTSVRVEANNPKTVMNLQVESARLDEQAA